MIIKLFDNESYMGYPLIEIKDNSFNTFKKDLSKYRKENIDDYNDEEFYRLLENKEYFIRFIYYDKEVFF